MRRQTFFWQRNGWRGPVAVALAGVLALAAGCDRSEAPAPDPDARADVDPEAIEQQVAGFEQRFTQLFDGEGDTARLLADMADFVERHPDRYDARRLYAQTLQMIGQGEAAFQQYEAAAQLQPEDTELRLLVGDTAMELRRYEDAQLHYSRAADTAPRDGRLRVRLAQSLIEQERYTEARDILLRQALPLDSSLHSAHIALADLYARQGNTSMALQQIDRALELLPDTRAEAERRLVYVLRQAALLRRANRPSDALAALDELSTEQLFRIDVARSMAQCWSMLGQPERAAEHFDFLLRRDPSDDLAAADAATWHLKAGQLDIARRRMEQLRRINPRSPALPELEGSLAEPTDTAAAGE